MVSDKIYGPRKIDKLLILYIRKKYLSIYIYMRILYKKFVYSITLSKVSQLFNLNRSSTSLINNANY